MKSLEKTSFDAIKSNKYWLKHTVEFHTEDIIS